MSFKDWEQKAASWFSHKNQAGETAANLWKIIAVTTLAILAVVLHARFDNQHHEGNRNHQGERPAPRRSRLRGQAPLPLSEAKPPS